MNGPPPPPPLHSLPFGPTPEQKRCMPMFERNHVPTYLFRIHTPSSPGSTTASTVTPPVHASCRHSSERDIFSLPPQQAAAMLNGHLRRDPAHEERCNLTSWTSSLLCALQYGLHWAKRDGVRRAAGKGQKGSGRSLPSNLSDIKLVVLSTTGLPRGTFVKDVEMAEVFAPHLARGEKSGQQSGNHAHRNRGARMARQTEEDNEEEDDEEGDNHDYGLDEIMRARKNTRYVFGEYLTQGRLDVRGRCVRTDLQALVNEGLFMLAPTLASHTITLGKGWHKGVMRQRGIFYMFSGPNSFIYTISQPETGSTTTASSSTGGTSTPTTTTTTTSTTSTIPISAGSVYGLVPPVTSMRDTNIAWRIARNCFSGPGDWAGPIMPPIMPLAAMLLSLMPRRRRDPSISLSFGNSPFGAFRALRGVRVDSHGMPELVHFRNMLVEIYNLYYPGDITWNIEPYAASA